MSLELTQLLDDHGFERANDAMHAIPGVCLREFGTPLADPCPEGRTVVEVDRYGDRWFVVNMVLEDLLPLLGLAVAAGYGAEDDD